MFENLYVHLPFCRSKCGYCSFYSEPGREGVIDRYLDRIERDLAAANLENVDTVYVGGGTPTLLSVPQLERLAAMLPEAAERSIESNPETLDAEKAAMLAARFTRISTGVQSFSALTREKLGRRCSDAAIRGALAAVAEAPFAHRNIDLIYAVAGQTPEEWAADLDEAMRYPIDHLSCYALTLDEAVNSNEPDLAAITLAKTAGALPRYEVSNYAKPGCECRHNLNVWHGRTYLGVGAAASSFDGRDRFTQPDNLNRFLAGDPPEYDRIPKEKREREIFAFNLRTVRGWEGHDAEKYLPFAQDSIRLHPEFWETAPGILRLTPLGLDFWDTVAAECL